MTDHSIFTEVALILALAAGVGLVSLVLRQPLIVAFLAVGVIAGPAGLGLVQSEEYILLLAELGVAVLLFVVGLKLDVQLVRTLGVVAVITGLGQMLFTAGLGYLIGIALGMTPLTALYVAVALTFSSTIIIVKMLSDKRESDALHGRMALGVLIVQDLAVVLAMIALSTLNVGAEVAERSSWETVARVAGGGVVLLAALALFIRYLAERLLRLVARAPELLVTFAIAWAVGLAGLTDLVGFGKEVGGLLAGVGFASTSFRDAVASRLGSLRDFLLLFFFVGLGIQFDLTLLGGQIVPAVLLSVFVLVAKPVIVLVIMGLMGYRRRTSILTGLTLAQISEFSLILMAMGLTLGHVSGETVGLVTLVGMITITLSTYMILYSQRLHAWLDPVLGVFEKAVAHREVVEGTEDSTDKTFEVVMIGLGRYGTALAAGLEEHGMLVLGIDADPEAVRSWGKRGHPVLYGDAADPGLAAELPLEGVRWVVIAIPPHPRGLSHADPRRALLHALRSQPGDYQIGVIARDDEDAEELQKLGAHLVLQPFPDAAVRAVERLVGEGE